MHRVPWKRTGVVLLWILLSQATATRLGWQQNETQVSVLVLTHLFSNTRQQEPDDNAPVRDVRFGQAIIQGLAMVRLGQLGVRGAHLCVFRFWCLKWEMRPSSSLPF